MDWEVEDDRRLDRLVLALPLASASAALSAVDLLQDSLEVSTGDPSVIASSGGIELG